MELGKMWAEPEIRKKTELVRNCAEGAGWGTASA